MAFKLALKVAGFLTDLLLEREDYLSRAKISEGLEKPGEEEKEEEEEGEEEELATDGDNLEQNFTRASEVTR